LANLAANPMSGLLVSFSIILILIFFLGIVIFEIFSRGMIPYFGLSNSEAIEKIVAGQLLAKPEECPEELYDVMKQCWQKNPNDRPTFDKLLEQLENINERYNAQEKANKLEVVADEQIYNS
jgi:serine/threonine protein kinase